MTRRGLGYIVMALLVAVAATTKIYHDQNERNRRETIEMQRSSRQANLQPELSPPPPDEMWAQKSPTPSRRGVQMMERPEPNTTSPGAAPTQPAAPTDNRPERGPNDGTNNGGASGVTTPGAAADPLLRDRAQLQSQLNQLDPAQLNQQIAQRAQDLTQLHNQLNQYTSALQNLDQQRAQNLQYQQVLQETALNELDSRIRIQERLIQSTREQQAQVQQNPVMFDPGTAPSLAAQLIAQDQQLQNLLAQRASIPAQTMQQMQGLDRQTLTDRTSLETARVAVQSQIRFIEQDLSRLNQEKTNNDLLRAQYQREITLIDRQLSARGINPERLPTIQFP